MWLTLLKNARINSKIMHEEKSSIGSYITFKTYIKTIKNILDYIKVICHFKTLYIRKETIKERYPKTLEILKRKHKYDSSKLLFYLKINEYHDDILTATEDYINDIAYLNKITWNAYLSSKFFFEEKQVEQPKVEDFSELSIELKKTLHRAISDVDTIQQLVITYSSSVVSIYFGCDISTLTFEFLQDLLRDYSKVDIYDDIKSFNTTINEDRKNFPNAISHFLKHPSVFYSDGLCGRMAYQMVKSLLFYDWERYLKIKDTIPKAAIMLLCDGKMPLDDDFSIEAHDKRIILFQYFDKRTKHFCKKFSPLSLSCVFHSNVDHIKSVHNSYEYGNTVTFADTFSYNDFYDLAITCEKNNTTFDEAIEYIEINKDAIKAWNKSKGLDRIIYTDNYSEVASNHYDLIQFIDTYNKEKARKEEVERLKREEERKRKEAKEAEERRQEQEERDNIYMVTHALKTNNIAIRNHLSENDIHYFYHFTDRRNLDSIIRHRGLYSWKYCETHNICIPYAGGNPTSRSLDCRYNLEDYIRLSFCNNHPMAFNLSQKGYNLVLLKIKVDVAELEATLFSDMNATDNNCKFGSTLTDLQRVDINATKQYYLRRTDSLFKKHQAEVLVKTFIPIDKIINIDFPQSI